MAASAAVALDGGRSAVEKGRTLIVTLDRFRQGARTFGVYSTPGQPIPVSQHVDLLEIDTLAQVADLWSTLRGVVAVAGGSVFGEVGTIDPAELTGLPGVEQFLAWRRIRDEAVSGRWTRVVVDCSGASDPLSFLAVPTMVAGYIERIWPRQRRLTGVTENPRLTGGAAVVDAVVSDCTDLAELLVDPSVVRAHLVHRPDLYGVETCERQLAVLSLLGVAVGSVVANPIGSESAVFDPAVFDPDGLEPAGFAPGTPDGHPTGPSGVSGREFPVEIRKRLDPTGQIDWATTRLLPQPPRTVAALRKVGARLDTAPRRAAGSSAARVEQLGGTGLTTTFRLSWPQPLPDPRTLSMGRSGDDLVVSLCGYRHRVTLPSVLRRCTVHDARWEDGMLSVRFQPDPRVWPRNGSAVD
ncbi:ArsA family ATPase [Williamsia sp. CHRR-6]|nr:ArsA family ATPase [Williamsia sp. CHRR-6]